MFSFFFEPKVIFPSSYFALLAHLLSFSLTGLTFRSIFASSPPQALPSLLLSLPATLILPGGSTFALARTLSFTLLYLPIFLSGALIHCTLTLTLTLHRTSTPISDLRFTLLQLDDSADDDEVEDCFPLAGNATCHRVNYA